jgi:DNA modification methylase
LSVTILIGDAREQLRQMADESVHCCVTSPPYFGLRSYLRNDHPSKHLEMGLEATPEEFVAGMVEVFREVRRVLRSDGTLWLNIGDSYSQGGNGSGPVGSKQKTNLGAHLPPKRTPGFGHKQLIGIPWRLALALQADGWVLRQDIIWSKPNPMPESVTDRCTKAHEYLFLLSKSGRYYFDGAAIAEAASGEAPGNKRATKGGRAYDAGATEHRTAANLHEIGARETRNRRSVWEVATQPFKEAHFATFPPALIKPCILAGCPVEGMVLDPFGGAGTTGLVAQQLGRSATLIELNDDYEPMADRRIRNGNIGLPLGTAA